MIFIWLNDCSTVAVQTRIANRIVKRVKVGGKIPLYTSVDCFDCSTSCIVGAANSLFVRIVSCFFLYRACLKIFYPESSSSRSNSGGEV